MSVRAIVAGSTVILIALSAHGQQGSTNPNSVINIHISQSVPTVNYLTRGTTKVSFVGTALLPRAEGEAKVGTRGSDLRVQGEFKGLVSPSIYGSVYLVYVLWAVTPEGRATNLGQLDGKDGKNKIDATTKLQTFGMMVTAEPYFAVSVPSEQVVLANSIRSNTRGAVSEVDANMALLHRGHYSDLQLPALEVSPAVPLDLYQARNAVRIAKAEQAEKYAPAAFAKADQALTRAENDQGQKQKNGMSSVARQAVQSAEDAREISMKHQEEEQIAMQQEATLAVAAQAEAQAQLSAEQRAAAQQQAAQAEQQTVAAQASEQQAQANAQTDLALAGQAIQEKQQLRARLLSQFNQVLPTTDTSRGLMVNMGDVLFATGRSDLRPAAKEALAKLSGIVLNYATLKLGVEGYTDNTGTEAFNQTLSQERAESVRNYLVQHAVSASSVSATGMGESMPVANNDTSAGRTQNRRVEIIVSGNVIGARVGGAE
jgi:outer membrane protein OmpA-like peptidoglycan-associated protein